MAEFSPFDLRTAAQARSPRSAEAILADLLELDRANDRLELRLALVSQTLKAAEARGLDDSDAVLGYLDRAGAMLRKVG